MTHRRKIRKLGRNAPCPCGSGRKYKRCPCVKPNPFWDGPALVPAQMIDARLAGRR